MRISESDRQKILNTLKLYLAKTAVVYLFGSRVDDKKRGGDLDLLILTHNDIQAKTLQMKKHFIVAALKDQLGDQKIDVLIRAKSDLNQDIFLQDIFEQAIPL